MPSYTTSVALQVSRCSFSVTMYYMLSLTTIEREAKATPGLVIEDAHQHKRIVSSMHDSCHLGVNRTLDMVAAKYYWPGLSEDVKKYVSQCVGDCAI